MFTKYRRRLMRHAGPPVRGAKPQGKADQREKPELAPLAGARTPAVAARTASLDGEPPHETAEVDAKAPAPHAGNALATRSAVKSALAGAPDKLDAAPNGGPAKVNERLGAVNLQRRAEG